MRIYTKLGLTWSGGRYIVDVAEGFDYVGPIERLCGATAGQSAIAGQQQSAYNTMVAQAGQVFGDSSAVYGDLMKTFAPTVAAGPSQQGFSPAELANLNSTAITDTGQAYKNAKSAVGEAESAQGGGNTGDVSGGSKTGTDLGIATSAAAQTSGELSQIEEQNYATGRQNYDTAVKGLADAPSVFGAADSANNAATNAGNAASNTANEIAQQSNSWVQSVTGALGAVGGAAASAGMSKLGGGGSSPIWGAPSDPSVPGYNPTGY
jgi:hypothetical protein